MGNGLVSQTVVELMHHKMKNDLPIDDIHVCYHHQKDACDCRKPKIGMLQRAALHFPIDLRKSFMIGDRYSDVEAGKNFGCKTIFIDYGYNERMTILPDITIHKLSEALPVLMTAIALR